MNPSSSTSTSTSTSSSSSSSSSSSALALAFASASIQQFIRLLNNLYFFLLASSYMLIKRLQHCAPVMFCALLSPGSWSANRSGNLLPRVDTLGYNYITLSGFNSLPVFYFITLIDLEKQALRLMLCLTHYARFTPFLFPLLF